MTAGSCVPFAFRVPVSCSAAANVLSFRMHVGCRSEAMSRPDAVLRRIGLLNDRALTWISDEAGSGVASGQVTSGQFPVLLSATSRETRRSRDAE